MKGFRPSGRHGIAWVLGVLAAAALAPRAGADTQFRISFSDMVMQSQHIVLATCVDRKAIVRNGNIVTHYTLKLQENWKGALKLDKAGQFAVEELGGRLDGPLPLAQVTPSMANLGVGEEVLLFASYPTIPPAVATLYANRPMTIPPDMLRIMGGRLGHLTVFNHPETGQPLVARMNVGDLPGSPVAHALTAEVRTSALAKLAVADPTTSATAATSGTLAALRQRNVEASLMMQRQSIVDEANRKVGARIDALAKQAQQAAARPAAAGTPQDDIYQFEPLADVRARVTRILNHTAAQ